MSDPKGFMKYAREGPKRRPVELRVLDWKEFYEPISEEKLQTQGARCMDCGVPFCQSTNGCPVVNHHSGVERPRAPWPLGRCAQGAAHHQQLPGIHRPPLSQHPANRPACSGSMSDPVSIRVIEWNIIDRGFNEGLVATDPADMQRPARRWPSSAQDRLAWPLRSSWRARATPCTLFEKVRPDRRLAPLRHPRLQDGKMGHRPAPGSDEGRGRRVQDQCLHREGPLRANSCGSSSMPLASPWARSRPVSCRFQGVNSRACISAMDYLTQQNKRNAGDSDHG